MSARAHALGALRRRLRAARRALEPGVQQAAADALARRVAATQWFRTSRRIGCYLPFDGEIDPLPLMERAWLMGKEIYLPILSPVPGRGLAFARYEPGEPLWQNRFGIPEPACGPARWTDPRALDLVLLPLVGFDARGNRLGMGAGYYDRTFAFLRQRRSWMRPRLVGLAYECQRVPRLPQRGWDVPLAGCVTERRVYRWQRGR